MQPHRGERQEVEATETDLGLMESVNNAFDLCPQLKGGLPSMMDDIKDLVSSRFNNRESARSLEQLVAEEGTSQMHSMKSMLASMLVATIKETKTKRGNREPVYSEEVELMFNEEGRTCGDRLAYCMGEIN